MPEIVAVAVGVIASGAGLFMQAQGAKKQQKGMDAQYAISQQQAALSAQAEAARQKQMQISARREQQKIIQQHSIAAALARARNVSGGTSAAGSLQSSAYGGGQSQLASQTGEALGTSYATEAIGNQIFGINQQQTALGGQSADAQSSINKGQQGINLGASLFTVGSAITSNAKTSADNWGSIKSSLFS